MSENAKHTPGEWIVRDAGIYAGGGLIACTGDEPTPGDSAEQQRANAERIVLCVNAHEELVAALCVAEKRLARLAKILEQVEWIGELEQVRAALSRATGAAK